MALLSLLWNLFFYNVAMTVLCPTLGLLSMLLFCVSFARVIMFFCAFLITISFDAIQCCSCQPLRWPVVTVSYRGYSFERSAVPLAWTSQFRGQRDFCQRVLMIKVIIIIITDIRLFMGNSIAATSLQVNLNEVQTCCRYLSVLCQ